MSWNDFNVGDGNFKGKLLYNCMESCRLALVERTNATYIYLLPQSLLQPLRHKTPEKRWFKDFEETVDRLIPRFIDHTYNGGCWNMLDHRPPLWSKDSIMKHIGEERIYMGRTIRAEWFSQQFKILNLLRQRKICDTEYPYPYLNPEWMFVYTEKTGSKYVCDLVIDKTTLSEAFPEFAKYWNTHSYYGNLITDAIGTVFNSSFFDTIGYHRQCAYNLYRIKGRGVMLINNVHFPYTVNTDFYCRIASPGAKSVFCTFGEHPTFTQEKVYYHLNSAKINFSLKGKQYFPDFGSERSLPSIPVTDAPWAGGWVADVGNGEYCIIKFDSEGGFKFK